MIHQSYRALQIILVDDGSTDKSHTIAAQYAEQDTRIALYSQPNRGQAAARNEGLQHATGEWVSFVDADDYLDSDYYEHLLQHSANNDCVQIGYRRVTADGEILEEKYPRHFYQFTSPCMRIYRREVLIQHHLTFPEGIRRRYFLAGLLGDLSYVYQSPIYGLQLHL